MENEKISISAKYLELSDKTQAIILEIAGRIDATTSLILEETLSQILRDRYYHIAVSLTDLKYINSTGMGLLLQYAEQFIANMGSFCLVSIPQKIRTLFSMLGIMTVFQTLDSVSAYQVYVEEFLKKKHTAALTSSSSQNASPSPDGLTEASSSGAPFPLVFPCPSCKGKLTIPRFGYFRCARCSHYFHLNEHGERLINQPSKLHTMHLNFPCKINFMKGIDELLIQFLESQQFAESYVVAISKVFEELGILLLEKTLYWSENIDFLIVCNPNEFRAVIKIPFALFQIPGEEQNNINFQLIQKMMQEVALISLENGTQLIRMTKKIG